MDMILLKILEKGDIKLKESKLVLGKVVDSFLVAFIRKTMFIKAEQFVCWFAYRQINTQEVT